MGVLLRLRHDRFSIRFFLLEGKLLLVLFTAAIEFYFQLVYLIFILTLFESPDYHLQ